MLRRLEYVTLFESDVRFKELTEALRARSVEILQSKKRSKVGVILANSGSERRFLDRFECREKMLLLDLEVRLQVA